MLELEGSRDTVKTHYKSSVFPFCRQKNQRDEAPQGYSTTLIHREMCT